MVQHTGLAVHFRGHSVWPGLAQRGDVFADLLRLGPVRPDRHVFLRMSRCSYENIVRDSESPEVGVRAREHERAGRAVPKATRGRIRTAVGRSIFTGWESRKPITWPCAGGACERRLTGHAARMFFKLRAPLGRALWRVVGRPVSTRRRPSPTRTTVQPGRATCVSERSAAPRSQGRIPTATRRHRA